jgi:hypothetical protein
MLEDTTTISWLPLTTELQTISGDETSTTTIEAPVTEGGVVTKTTYVLITVRGGTTATVTTTIAVPPFTTNMIVSFSVVLVEPVHSHGTLNFASVKVDICKVLQATL